jgi:hypothetical protein
LPASAALDEAVAAVRADLAKCDAVLIAGGHMAVLRNRIRLFGLDAALTAKSLVGTASA